MFVGGLIKINDNCVSEYEKRVDAFTFKIVKVLSKLNKLFINVPLSTLEEMFTDG